MPPRPPPPTFGVPELFRRHFNPEFLSQNNPQTHSSSSSAYFQDYAYAYTYCTIQFYIKYLNKSLGMIFTIQLIDYLITKILKLRPHRNVFIGFFFIQEQSCDITLWGNKNLKWLTIKDLLLFDKFASSKLFFLVPSKFVLIEKLQSLRIKKRQNDANLNQT